MNTANSEPRTTNLLQSPFGMVIFGWSLAAIVLAVIVALVVLAFRDFKPVNRTAAAIIIAIWLVLTGLVIVFLIQLMRK